MMLHRVVSYLIMLNMANVKIVKKEGILSSLRVTAYTLFIGLMKPTFSLQCVNCCSIWFNCLEAIASLSYLVSWAGLLNI